MIRYYCSDGTRVSEATIKSNLSKAYREYDDGSVGCRGCGNRAEGHAHIVPKARLKQLHLTDLIWAPELWVKACHKCNQVIENVTSNSFKILHCYDHCLSILQKYDPERYQKALN